MTAVAIGHQPENVTNGPSDPLAVAERLGPSAEGAADHHQEDPAKQEASASIFSRSPLLGMMAAAAVGAIVAAGAVIALTPQLAPPMDVRLVPLADRVAAMELRQQQAEAALGRLNNEIALALDADDAAAIKMEKQFADLAAMQPVVSDRPVAAAAPVPVRDTSLTNFAVAVGQLRSAFYSGRPFEAEIVTLRTMAEVDLALPDLLSELSTASRLGVANPAMLREQFAGYAATAGVRLNGSRSYYDYGVSLVSEYIGYNSLPYAVELTDVMVADADRKLAEGDVAGAIEAIAGLEMSTAALFQPWLKSAGAYVRAEAAIASMTHTVTDRLRERLGTDDAG